MDRMKRLHFWYLSKDVIKIDVRLVMVRRVALTKSAPQPRLAIYDMHAVTT